MQRKGREIARLRTDLAVVSGWSFCVRKCIIVIFAIESVRYSFRPRLGVEATLRSGGTTELLIFPRHEQSLMSNAGCGPFAFVDLRDPVCDVVFPCLSQLTEPEALAVERYVCFRSKRRMNSRTRMSFAQCRVNHTNIIEPA